ncbi:YHYH protein [Glaciecola sp. MF2-115]|uniref:YHYH protein n=1 Tax=Glaciecola sp. MF2-115 TaxID=3384827 RepID=UPI0039A3E7C0
MPTDLDVCNGHTSVTADYPNGVYHYHASLDASNLPSCISGAAVRAHSSAIATYELNQNKQGIWSILAVHLIYISPTSLSWR